MDVSIMCALMGDFKGIDLRPAFCFWMLISLSYGALKLSKAAVHILRSRSVKFNILWLFISSPVYLQEFSITQKNRGFNKSPLTSVWHLNINFDNRTRLKQLKFVVLAKSSFRMLFFIASSDRHCWFENGFQCVCKLTAGSYRHPVVVFVAYKNF